MGVKVRIFDMFRYCVGGHGAGLWLSALRIKVQGVGLEGFGHFRDLNPISRRLRAWPLGDLARQAGKSLIPGPKTLKPKPQPEGLSPRSPSSD